LGFLVPEQVDQVRVGLLAGLLEPPLLDLPVEGLPLGGVLAGPTATGLRPPVDFLGDGLPRVADGTYLGGGGQQGLDVRAHDGVLFPRSKCAGRFAATRRLCGAERVGGGKWGGAAGMDVAARDVQTSLRSFPRLVSLSGQNFSNPRKAFVDEGPRAWRTARVSASTQNQAFSALLFLYRDVLQVDPGRIDGVIRANRPKRLPVVLTRNEVRRVLSRLDGTYRLMGQLMYGSGLRLLEWLRLRVQDIDFGRGEIVVREGKGNKDRRTMLAAVVRPDLAAHIERVRLLHEKDLTAGFGRVYLPDALERKLPNAAA